MYLSLMLSSVTILMYGVPNVVIRYLDNPDGPPLRSIYKNDNPESIVSTVRRGRQIVDVESVEDIADQDTLDAYTRVRHEVA